MPTFSPHMIEDIKEVLKRLRSKIYTVVGDLDITAWRTPEPQRFAQRRKGEKINLKIGDSWTQKVFDCAWFNFKGKIPADSRGCQVVALIDINGELCIFDKQGVPVRGLTNGSSAFARAHGEPLKRVYEITPKAKGGEAVNIWADAGCNDLFGLRQNDARIEQAHIAVCNKEIRGLYYDMEVLHDFILHQPKDSARYQKIYQALRDACILLRHDSDAEIRKARKILKPLLAMKNGDSSLEFSAVGHAHLDLGWLWPIRETIRKGARTFATAIDLIERYPKYIFSVSQPQLFVWMREYYPELYKKIKKAVMAGRIEAQGAAWVESDTNMPSGESLVRQLLYGKRFFADEFGLNITNLWLPDVFGYTAAMPRILKGCGIDTFMTQKLSWSKINVYPHHSFIWQGLGEDEVLAHLLPEDNYNSAAAPRSVIFAEKNYKDKDVSSHALLLFGIGDGGGGPGMEHLERLERIENFAGICPVRQESSVDFFEKWRMEAERFSKWTGELYVEMHQGTLTTHGNVKRYNRLAEIALHDWEASCVFAGCEYPQQRIEEIWKEILLYQFHDILPGSSIKRVYDEAYERYEILLAEINEGIADRLKDIADSVDTEGMIVPAVVFNTLSWPRNEWLKVGKNWKKVLVPPMGYAAVDVSDADVSPELNADENTLENDLLRLRFDGSGMLSSIYDKRLKKEILAKGGKGNRLEVFRDRGDAWDFPMDYAEQSPEKMSFVSREAHIDGPKAVLRQRYKYQDSTLEQDIVLTAGSARIDFETRAKWASPDTMLRASFPVGVRADYANYEIQFGHISRTTHNNTSWDMAKHEVAAHKYADLSQKDFGVAVLNDCKYGHKIKGNTIELNLLRSAPFPREVIESTQSGRNSELGFTDLCEHIFTYSILPHVGDLIDGDVMQAGYELNYPLRVVLPNSSGCEPAKMSAFCVDNPAVIIETVKKAEDSDATVLRLYESRGGNAKAVVAFAGEYGSAMQADMLEQPGRAIKISNGKIRLSFKPFEIKTIILK